MKYVNYFFKLQKRLRALSGINCPSTGTASSCRTAEAMSACNNFPYCKCLRIKITNVRTPPVWLLGLEVQHLIEVAIKNSAVPGHGKGVAAHQAIYGCGVKSIDQEFHIALQIARSLKPFQEP